MTSPVAKKRRNASLLTALDDELDSSTPTRTRRESQRFCWCFTQNDKQESYDLLDNLNAGLIDNVKYCIVQLERQQRTHMQGYVELTVKKRMSWMQEYFSPGAHYEARQGSREQARTYCAKLDTRVDGPWEFGKWVTTGSKSNIDSIRVKIRQGQPMITIADEHFGDYVRYHRGIEAYITLAKTLNTPERDGIQDIEVIVIYGPPGCGKSHLANEKWPDAYAKPPQSKWWCHYRGELVTLFQDFNKGWIQWDTFMNILDKYKCLIEPKNGHRQLHSTTFVFTTNTHPCEWYPKMIDKYDALERRITKCYNFTGHQVYEEVKIEDLPNNHYGRHSRFPIPGIDVRSPIQPNTPIPPTPFFSPPWSECALDENFDFESFEEN